MTPAPIRTRRRRIRPETERKEFLDILRSVDASMKICAAETVKSCVALDTMAATMSSMAVTEI